jgi:hypothetical protein
MATKITTSYVDDIDGTDASGTVSFTYDSKSYEIDLSDKNKKSLEDALAPYIKAARSTGGRGRSTSGSPRGGGRTDLAAIRAWAKDNGHEVSDRGRIPATVIEAYDEAH